MNCLYIIVVLLAKVIDHRDAQPASQAASRDSIRHVDMTSPWAKRSCWHNGGAWCPARPERPTRWWPKSSTCEEVKARC